MGRQETRPETLHVTRREQRKLALGVCTHAFGTARQHEHACVRCPVLRPDPEQIPDFNGRARLRQRRLGRQRRGPCHPS